MSLYITSRLIPRRVQSSVERFHRSVEKEESVVHENLLNILLTDQCRIAGPNICLKTKKKLLNLSEGVLFYFL